MAERADLAAEVSEALALAEEARGEDDVKQGDGSHEARQKHRARRVEAMSLRLAGFTYEQIGNRLGVTGDHVAIMIRDTLAKAENRTVDEMRKLENERLDRVQAAIWSKVLEGDDKAINSFLKISGQRSKINGLYAPTRIDMNIGIKQDMEAALRDLEELVAVRQNEVIMIQEAQREITNDVS